MPDNNTEQDPQLSHTAAEKLVKSVVDYAIFMLDSYGRIRTWNTGAERIKGYTAGEIVSEHFSRCYTD